MLHCFYTSHVTLIFTLFTFLHFTRHIALALLCLLHFAGYARRAILRWLEAGIITRSLSVHHSDNLGGATVEATVAWIERGPGCWATYGAQPQQPGGAANSPHAAYLRWPVP